MEPPTYLGGTQRAGRIDDFPRTPQHPQPDTQGNGGSSSSSSWRLTLWCLERRRRKRFCFFFLFGRWNSPERKGGSTLVLGRGNSPDKNRSSQMTPEEPCRRNDTDDLCKVAWAIRPNLSLSRSACMGFGDDDLFLTCLELPNFSGTLVRLVLAIYSWWMFVIQGAAFS